MDNSQGGPGEDGAQGEPAEPEDADKSRTYASRNGEPEPETPVVNGEKETSKGEPGTDEIDLFCLLVFERPRMQPFFRPAPL